MSNWYLQNGKASDVVVSSRVRLVRNLNGFKFLNKCSKEEQEKILEKIKEIVPSLGYGLKYMDLKDIDDVTKLSLVEKHLISPEFVMNDNAKKAIIINDEENICIMINEDDHIKIQVFSSGQELDNLMSLVVEIDEKLGEILEYSYSQKFVYLTASPINVVTGIVLSVLMIIVLSSITRSSIKAIDDRKYEIGILKAIGYKNKNIKTILLFENLIIGIRAYLIGLIISIISMYLIKIFIFNKNIDFDRLNVNLNVWVCIVALIFSILIPTIASYLGGKGIFKKTPLSLNKEG